MNKYGINAKYLKRKEQIQWVNYFILIFNFFYISVHIKILILLSFIEIYRVKKNLFLNDWFYKVENNYFKT